MGLERLYFPPQISDSEPDDIYGKAKKTEKSFLSVGKNLAKSRYFSLIIQANSKNEYTYFLNRINRFLIIFNRKA